MAWRQRLALRIADIDGLGHLTAAAYIVLFEENRSRWMLDDLGVVYPSFVIARQSIEYLHEVRLSAREVTVELAVTRIGTTSIDLVERLSTDTCECSARCEATAVMWDRDARRSRPIAPAERTLFEAALASGADR